MRVTYGEEASLQHESCRSDPESVPVSSVPDRYSCCAACVSWDHSSTCCAGQVTVKRSAWCPAVLCLRREALDMWQRRLTSRHPSVFMKLQDPGRT